MGDSIRRSPLTVALAVLALLLAAILAAEFTWGGRGGGGAGARRVVPAEAKLLPPLAQITPDQAYPETASRPLFTPTRRPAPEAAVAAQPTLQRGQFVLVGVIVSGSTRTAMLREKSSGRVHRAEVGREINGIKVSQIEKESVLLSQGVETETVGLSVQRPGGPGQPGQPSQAAGQPAMPGMPAQPTALVVPQGPFGPANATPRLPPGVAPQGPAPAPSQPSPAQPGFPMPATPQSGGAPMPMQSISPGGMPMQSGNAPGAPAAEAALTPEEILARRRQRRAQQNQ